MSKTGHKNLIEMEKDCCRLSRWQKSRSSLKNYKQF